MKKPDADLTVLPPNPAATDDRRGPGWAMRKDLLDSLRGRIRLVALLLLFAFVFDPILHAGLWMAAML